MQPNVSHEAFVLAALSPTATVNLPLLLDQQELEGPPVAGMAVRPPHWPWRPERGAPVLNRSPYWCKHLRGIVAGGPNVDVKSDKASDMEDVASEPAHVEQQRIHKVKVGKSISYVSKRTAEITYQCGLLYPKQTPIQIREEPPLYLERKRLVFR